MKKKPGQRIALTVILLLMLMGTAYVLLYDRLMIQEESSLVSEQSARPELSNENVDEELWLPVLPAPSVYMGSFGGDDYAIFVETSDEHELRGHYLFMEDEQSDTVAFCIEAKSKHLSFQDDKRNKTLKIKALNVNSDTIAGRLKTGVFSRADFNFKPYQKPRFYDYENGRYRSQAFKVNEIHDVHYADAPGYWTELDVPDNAFNDQLRMLRNTLYMRRLPLKMDVYEPLGDTLRRRPLVMLIHGGAFYLGTRKAPAMQAWCRHLASLGYVAVSIDYRIGFTPTLAGIERAGYRAIQDAHAAMRYLVENQSLYRVDTSMIFVGGSSAGAITSLNLAYMTNKTRPESSKRGFMRDDLGNIDTEGNGFRHSFTLKGVVDMWGAISDLSLLENAHTPILAFHGNCDNVVPYGYDYPFESARSAKKALFNKVYGSSCIVKRALELGIDARLFTFDGCRHSPHRNSDGSLNENFNFIRDTMSTFFHNVMIPKEPAIVGDENHFAISCSSPVDSLCWKVDGGLIADHTDGEVKVVWIRNAPEHQLSISGKLPRGIGFTKRKEINLF